MAWLIDKDVDHGARVERSGITWRRGDGEILGYPLSLAWDDLLLEDAFWVGFLLILIRLGIHAVQTMLDQGTCLFGSSRPDELWVRLMSLFMR